MQPPLSMISSCIQDGKLSLRLMKVCSSPMAPPCTVQVSVHLPKTFQGVITATIMAGKGLQSQKCHSVTAPAIWQFEYRPPPNVMRPPSHDCRSAQCYSKTPQTIEVQHWRSPAPQHQSPRKLGHLSRKVHALQICISGGQPAHLEKLRDGIHHSITGVARGPLSHVDPNVPRVCSCSPHCDTSTPHDASHASTQQDVSWQL